MNINISKGDLNLYTKPDICISLIRPFPGPFDHEILSSKNQAIYPFLIWQLINSLAEFLKVYLGCCHQGIGMSHPFFFSFGLYEK